MEARRAGLSGGAQACRPRALPYMLAANPINWGKAMMLSTAEALAASAYIMGEKEQAQTLMSKFIWGPTFLTMNKNPLDDYAAAKTSRGVVEAMHQYLPSDEAMAEAAEGAHPCPKGGASGKARGRPRPSARARPRRPPGARGRPRRRRRKKSDGRAPRARARAIRTRSTGRLAVFLKADSGGGGPTRDQRPPMHQPRGSEAPRVPMGAPSCRREAYGFCICRRS